MDISKLPKLSQSEAPPPPATPTPVANQQINFAPARPADGSFAEAWVSIAIGLILLLCWPHTAEYFASNVFHTPFAPFADPTRPFPAKCDFIMYEDGTKIYYRNLPDFWNDLVITSFALVLIVDGILLVRARRAGMALAALALTLAATLANLAYVIANLEGRPIVSALAVVFGGYIAMTQWAMYKRLSLKAN